MYGNVNCSFDNSPHWLLPLDVKTMPQLGTLYIWQASVTELVHFYDDLIALLNPAEKARAMRYYQQADRQRYVLQHGLLRLLLGWYTAGPNTNINFRFNGTKKPYLITTELPCFFNISHSGPEMLLAIGDQEMGVDIERINPGFDYRGIASQYFSPAEVAFINASANTASAFFLLWTRKEALLKACGTGIDDNLPNMPALDGLHQLPSGYQQTAWLTRSFNAQNNCMASLTYAHPKTGIALSHADAGLIAALLNIAE